MSSPNLNTRQALQAVAITISFCIAIQVLISFPLWQSTRSFPTLPVIDLSTIGFVIPEAFFLICMALGLLMIGFFQNRTNWGFWLTLLALSCLILTDINRLQVWICLLYTSPSPRDLSTSRMPSSA